MTRLLFIITSAADSIRFDPSNFPLVTLVWFPVVGVFLPSATVVAERLCFHKRLSFCKRGAMCGGGGIHGRGVAGGIHGRVCVAEGHAWQGACVAGGMCGRGGGMHGRRDSHCSGRYASYWNAFLFQKHIASEIWIHIGVEMLECM